MKVPKGDKDVNATMVSHAVWSFIWLFDFLSLFLLCAFYCVNQTPSTSLYYFLQKQLAFMILIIQVEIISHDKLYNAIEANKILLYAFSP